LKSKHGRNNLEKDMDSSDVEQQLTRRSLTWVRINRKREEDKRKEGKKETWRKKGKEIRRE